MTRAAQVQLIAGWVTVVISFVHFGVTFIDYDHLSLGALWFIGSGFALLLIGGLNVITASLSPTLFSELRGLRTLTLVADACGCTLGSVYVVLTNGTQPQGPVLVILFLTAAVSQLCRPREEELDRASR